MKLESKYDFKALRKAQATVTRNFNRAVKSIEKLNLGEEANAAIEKLLVPAYDGAMKEAAASVGQTAPSDGSFV